MENEASGVGIVRRYLESIRKVRADSRDLDWDMPPPPEMPDYRHQHRLDWRRPERGLTCYPLTLEEVRNTINKARINYQEDRDKRPPVLLVKVPPGVGKSHMATEMVQDMAMDGARVLYTAGRHRSFLDIMTFPHFNPELWYEWLPIHQSSGPDDPLQTTCRYTEAMLQWLARGYPSMTLCHQLCTYDRWVTECPYRQQAFVKKSLIFAMHQHLVYGLSVSGFHMAVVDEMPLQAFIRERRIPAPNIHVPASGPLNELLGHLASLTLGKKPLRGPELLAEIGPVLGDAFAQIEIDDNALPVIPHVYTPEDVAATPYFYIFDMLRLLSPEYDAWRNGWTDWVSRVAVSREGLMLYDRANTWKELPGKVMALDATGQVEIYRRIFGREVEELAPEVERMGKIYQIVGRLYGVSDVVEREAGEEPRLSKTGREMLEVSKHLARRYAGRVGVVTFKSAVKEFAAVFGDGNVYHFGALRGTNALQDVDCLIVAGGYAPPGADVLNTAAALNQDRIKPFVAQAEDGTLKAPWRAQWREYRLSESCIRPNGTPRGNTAWRQVTGYWDDPDLTEILDQSRKAEIVQAIHRARPNLRKCDVWLLTSIPTDEVLDGIWEDPPIGPEGMSWKMWLKLEPWLEEQHAAGSIITNAIIAEAMGVTLNWVTREKWLEAIVEYLPAQWDMAAVPSGASGGRPSKSLEARNAT